MKDIDLQYRVDYVMDSTGTLKPNTIPNIIYKSKDFKHCELKKRTIKYDIIICWNDDINDSVTFLGRYYDYGD